MSVNIPVTNKPRVVIIGGGFGGIELAKGLRKADVQIVLVDKNNYHTFQPLLYQVATAALEPDSIAYPLREIFKKQHNLLFRMAEVLKIKPESNAIETSIGDIEYDYLVIAVGSQSNYFGMEDFKRLAVSMKSVPQAMALRNTLLENFEQALLTDNIKKQESLMNVVIVGGGPTGVETAGALGELKNHVLPHDYPELNFQRMQIHLIDLADRLLNTMSLDASRSAENFLKKFDVQLWLKTSVTSYDGETLVLSNGKRILTNKVIWAAGVTGAVIPGLNPESILAGRIKVDQHNRVTGHKTIFAIGDVAAMSSEKLPKGYPMLAPVAIQQARLLARNLTRFIQNKAGKPFVYRDFGVMATVGRNNAVVDFKLIKFQGILGWFVWLFIHLMALVGFRNKVIAFINWMWNYFSYDRGLRLIIRASEK